MGCVKQAVNLVNIGEGEQRPGRAHITPRSSTPEHAERYLIFRQSYKSPKHR